MNFQPVGFLDTSLLTAQLLTRHRATLANAIERVVPLRGPDKDAPILEDWKTASNTLKRLKGMCAPLLNGKTPQLGQAFIVGLRPGATEEWRTDEDEAFFRLFVALTPSPAALVICGAEAFNPPIGMVYAVNRAVPHSAVNTGTVELLRLVVDIRKPPKEEAN